MLTLDQLQQAISESLARIAPLTQETCSLESLCGRVLAQDVTSAIALPGADVSAMDGYAFAGDSLVDNAELPVMGESIAGKPFAGALAAGECVRIMTGAVVPAGRIRWKCRKTSFVRMSELRCNRR